MRGDLAGILNPFRAGSSVGELFLRYESKQSSYGVRPRSTQPDPRRALASIANIKYWRGKEPVDHNSKEIFHFHDDSIDASSFRGTFVPFIFFLILLEPIAFDEIITETWKYFYTRWSTWLMRLGSPLAEDMPTFLMTSQRTWRQYRLKHRLRL